jgi:hypothetical protein
VPIPACKRGLAIHRAGFAAWLSRLDTRIMMWTAVGIVTCRQGLLSRATNRTFPMHDRRIPREMRRRLAATGCLH